MSYIPDWMRCINCKTKAKNGKIVHVRGCPDFVVQRKKK